MTTTRRVPMALPLRVGEAKHYRTGETFGRGLEILGADGLTVGNALPYAREYIVAAVNEHDELRAALGRLLFYAKRGPHDMDNADYATREIYEAEARELMVRLDKEPPTEAQPVDTLRLLGSLVRWVHKYLPRDPGGVNYGGLMNLVAQAESVLDGEEPVDQLKHVHGELGRAIELVESGHGGEADAILVRLFNELREA